MGIRHTSTVVHFHCFGECKEDWDIYDVIMLREKCSFRQAQQIWADFLGITGVSFYQGKSPTIPEPDEEPEPEDTVGFLEPAEPNDQIKATLAEAAGFYNELLLSDPDKFAKILAYLERRGIERPNIERFQVGYSPAYADEEYQGRALKYAFLSCIKNDYLAFRPSHDGCLVRLLNDESVKGYGYYRQQIDFSRKDPFSRYYGDYFAFYNLLQDQENPVVVSTLGSYLSAEAMSIFRSLGVEHFIVAYDWDPAGKKAITRIASEVGGVIYYLGGMQPGQDP